MNLRKSILKVNFCGVYTSEERGVFELVCMIILLSRRRKISK